MHAGHHDDIGIDLGSFAGECQRVANNIRYAVENFRCLVIMGQNDRILFRFQFIDCSNLWCKYRLFNRGDHTLHLFVEMCRFCFNLRGIGEGGLAWYLSFPASIDCGQFEFIYTLWE